MRDGQIIEMLLTEYLDNKPKVPMSKEQTMTLMTLIMAEEENNQKAIDEMYEELKKQAWVIEAIEKRLDICLTIKLSKTVIMAIVLFVQGNIGRCIIYLYFLQLQGRKMGVKDIDMDMFCKRIFPMGILSEDRMLEFWDNQKKVVDHKGINMIDYPKYSESLMF